LNKIIASYLLRFLNFTKKSSEILLICFIILLLVCLGLSFYYTEFIIQNFEGIKEFYILKIKS